MNNYLAVNTVPDEPYPAYGQLEEPQLDISPITYPGLDFFSSEDIASGRVEVETNPDEIGYTGDVGELSFVASGPPGLRTLIRYILKRQLRLRDISWLRTDIMETTTRQFFGLPVYGNYTVKLYYHGSPVAAIAPIIWLIFAALSVIAITITVYQVTEAIKSGDEVKRAEITKEIIEAMPEDTQEQKDAKSEAASKAIANLIKPEKPSLFGDMSKIGKYVVWGGAIYLGLQALSAVKELKK